MSLRSALKKDLVTKLKELNSDVVCLQETKLNETENIAPMLYPYQYFHHCTAKKGYSGTCVLSKFKPLKVYYGIPIDGYKDDEGRVITLEFENYYIVNTYVPNASTKLVRLDSKMTWMDTFYKWLNKLKETKQVIWTGDINVSHQPMDLANPKTNQKSAGFSIEERTKFGELLEIPPVPVTTKRKIKVLEQANSKKQKLENGDSAVCETEQTVTSELTQDVPKSLNSTTPCWVDAFRHLYPEKQEYSYFGFRTNAKARNVGWRLDYFILTKELIPLVSDVEIKNDFYGLSDHSPVVLTFKS